MAGIGNYMSVYCALVLLLCFVKGSEAEPAGCKLPWSKTGTGAVVAHATLITDLPHLHDAHTGAQLERVDEDAILLYLCEDLRYGIVFQKCQANNQWSAVNYQCGDSPIIEAGAWAGIGVFCFSLLTCIVMLACSYRFYFKEKAKEKTASAC